MLRYLTEHQIGIGDRIKLIGRQPFEGPLEITIHEAGQSLGIKLARAIRVERIAA